MLLTAIRPASNDQDYTFTTLNHLRKGRPSLQVKFLSIFKVRLHLDLFLKFSVFFFVHNNYNLLSMSKWI